MGKVVTQRDGFGVETQLTGMGDTLLALSAVDPKMYQEFRKRLSVIGKTVAGTASRSAPDGPTGEMKRGYTSRLRNRGRVSLVTASNKTREGAILEFAGSASRGKTKQGRSLIKSLDYNYGKPGRFLWDAHDLLEPWIIDQLNLAADQAERDLQAALDRAGE